MRNLVEAINAVMMDELKEIMGNDFELLITTYLADSEKKIREIKTAFESKNFESLKVISHSLKGSSLNLGVIKLADTASQLEIQASVAPIENIQGLINLLEIEFDHAKKAIAHFV